MCFSLHFKANLTEIFIDLDPFLFDKTFFYFFVKKIIYVIALHFCQNRSKFFKIVFYLYRAPPPSPLGLKGSQGPPRATTGSPRAPQGTPKGPQRTAKGSPRAPQREPKGAQSRPKGDQRQHRGPNYINKLPINRPSGRYVIIYA